MNAETQAQLLTLRDLLLLRLSDLEADLAHDRVVQADDGAVPAGETSDSKDAAGLAQRGQVDSAQFARDLAELASVKAALQRLDDGKYGDCMACGEPIALQRLRVQPAALRCAHCQTVFEHGPAGLSRAAYQIS